MTKKLVILMAVTFSLSATATFAHGGGKGKKADKCMGGKDCCKKMSKASKKVKA